MKQNYNYRIEVEDGNNLSIKTGSITSMCSGTRTSCSKSTKCSNCVNGSHRSYCQATNSYGVGSKKCLKCGTWSSSGGRYYLVFCTKCNPRMTTAEDYLDPWHLPDCKSCGATAAQQIAYLNHPCPTCSGHGYSRCTTHNKYGAHYYCSHSTTGTKHQ